MLITDCLCECDVWTATPWTRVYDLCIILPKLCPFPPQNQRWLSEANHAPGRSSVIRRCRGVEFRPSTRQKQQRDSIYDDDTRVRIDSDRILLCRFLSWQSCAVYECFGCSRRARRVVGMNYRRIADTYEKRLFVYLRHETQIKENGDSQLI